MLPVQTARPTQQIIAVGYFEKSDLSALESLQAAYDYEIPSSSIYNKLSTVDEYNSKLQALTDSALSQNSANNTVFVMAIQHHHASHIASGGVQYAVDRGINVLSVRGIDPEKVNCPNNRTCVVSVEPGNYNAGIRIGHHACKIVTQVTQMLIEGGKNRSCRDFRSGFITAVNESCPATIQVLQTIIGGHARAQDDAQLSIQTAMLRSPDISMVLSCDSARAEFIVRWLQQHYGNASTKREFAVLTREMILNPALGTDTLSLLRSGDLAATTDKTVDTPDGPYIRACKSVISAWAGGIEPAAKMLTPMPVCTRDPGKSKLPTSISVTETSLT